MQQQLLRECRLRAQVKDSPPWVIGLVACFVLFMFVISWYFLYRAPSRGGKGITK